MLHAGEEFDARTIALPMGAATNNVTVSAETRVEIAQEQLNIEEKQRVLGVFPNYYVSYDPNPAPLTPRQKFQLAWRTSIDPVTWAITGVIAGTEQATNTFAGYGQGAQGFGKRFGANYADNLSDTFIGGAILPSLFKQDPRYFYKGTGSVSSRALYAITNSVICKGDNGRWQPNYSSILGGLAAGGISNLYYPEQPQRHGSYLHQCAYRDRRGRDAESASGVSGAPVDAEIAEIFVARNAIMVRKGQIRHCSRFFERARLQSCRKSHS